MPVDDRQNLTNNNAIEDRHEDNMILFTQHRGKPVRDNFLVIYVLIVIIENIHIALIKLNDFYSHFYP